MKRAAFLALILLAGCETARRPYAPLDNIRYQALGAEPFWALAIGDDRIVLRTGGQDGDAVWPRTLPRSEGAVRTWQSGEGTGVITVEARPGPCTGAGGQVHENHVTVRLSGRELTGCGGRLVRRGRD